MASSPALAGQAQPKRTFPSSFPSGRRVSTSVIHVSPSKNLPLPPTKNSPNASTGIPAFRSLRSLLPFGPHKQATPGSAAVSNSSNVARSPFAHFGSMRRSLNRERKTSFDNDLSPVISIGPLSNNEEEHAVRRSASYSRVEGPQVLSEGLSNPFHEDEKTPASPENRPPILPTPSPGPPLPTDLSTIMEADTSGISKHVPSLSRSNSSDAPFASNRSPLLASHDKGDTSGNPGVDISINLSTTHLADEVRDAMMFDDSNVANQWLNGDKAVVIDEGHTNPDPNRSLDLGSVDTDLAALLSPHKHSTQSRKASFITKSRPRYPPLNTPLKDSSMPFQASPPNLTLTAPIPISGASPSFLRSQIPDQQSALSRLHSPSFHSPILPRTPTPGSTLPPSDGSYSLVKGDDDTARIGLPRPRIQQPTPPSPLSIAAASAPPSPAVGTFSKASPKFSPSPSTTNPASLSGPLSRRLPSRPHSSKQFTPASPAALTAESSTSTFSRLRTPFEQVTISSKPLLLRSTSSPDEELGVPRSSSTSSTSRSPSVFLPRSHPNTATRGTSSLDHPRPPISSAPPMYQSEFETPARPSLDTVRGIGKDAIRSGGGLVRNGSSTSFTLLRSRKRSQSVHERSVNHSTARRMSGERERGSGEEVGGSERGAEQRPDSRLSERIGRRWDGKVGNNGGGDGRPPITEWLGPRTAKAFKAAGLMDFERDQQQQQYERSSPGSISGLGTVSGPSGRYTPIRSTSEYNPRAPSRMAFSEAGGSSASRRGSVSGTVAGTQYGLMESPTFTTSSGSRDRDTPRSVSTAPTSVSGYSLPFSGRDRDRDRDDIRELKEKHATETGALLNALSDSQRTSKTLREENTELRDRLEQVEEDNSTLRTALEGIKKEVGDLRVQLLKATSPVGGRLANGTWSTITRRSALSTSIHTDHDNEGEEGYRGTLKSSGSDQLEISLVQAHRLSSLAGRDSNTYQRHHFEHSPGAFLPAGSSFSSTPARHRRRFSATSSIFPVPPANMTMLLHDQEQDLMSLNGTSDDSRFSPAEPPVTLDDDGNWTMNNDDPSSSVASAINISPTTATLSTTSGSPGSLFLRPEHEIHLGDMDSLDLGSAGAP